MDKVSNDRIRQIGQIIEEGVEEYGRDEGVNMEIHTTQKEEQLPIALNNVGQWHRNSRKLSCLMEGYD